MVYAAFMAGGDPAYAEDYIRNILVDPEMMLLIRKEYIIEDSIKYHSNFIKYPEFFMKVKRSNTGKTRGVYHFWGCAGNWRHNYHPSWAHGVGEDTYNHPEKYSFYRE